MEEQIKKLVLAVNNLEKHRGEKAASRFINTSITIIEWLRCYGHGQLTISSKDAVLGNKIDAREIIHVQ